MIKKPRSYQSGLLVLYGLGVVVGSTGGAVGASGCVVCWIAGWSDAGPTRAGPLTGSLRIVITGSLCVSFVKGRHFSLLLTEPDRKTLKRMVGSDQEIARSILRSVRNIPPPS
jgi:hypothetical protein